MDYITPGYGLLLWQLSGLVLIGFWVDALFDCVSNNFRYPNQKLTRIILFLFAPLIASFLYLNMNQRTKGKRTFSPDFIKNN